MVFINSSAVHRVVHLCEVVAAANEAVHVVMHEAAGGKQLLVIALEHPARTAASKGGTWLPPPPHFSWWARSALPQRSTLSAVPL